MATQQVSGFNKGYSDIKSLFAAEKQNQYTRDLSQLYSAKGKDVGYNDVAQVMAMYDPAKAIELSMKQKAEEQKLKVESEKMKMSIMGSTLGALVKKIDDPKALSAVISGVMGDSELSKVVSMLPKGALIETGTKGVDIQNFGTGIGVFNKDNGELQDYHFVPVGQIAMKIYTDEKKSNPMSTRTYEETFAEVEKAREQEIQDLSIKYPNIKNKLQKGKGNPAPSPAVKSSGVSGQWGKTPTGKRTKLSTGTMVEIKTKVK